MESFAFTSAPARINVEAAATASFLAASTSGVRSPSPRASMFAPEARAAVIAAGSLRSTASKSARSDSGVDGGFTPVIDTAAAVVADAAIVDVTGVSDELQPANAPVTHTARITQTRADLPGSAVTADYFLGQEFQASA